MNNLTEGMRVSEHGGVCFLAGMWDVVTAMWLNYFKRPDSAYGYR